MQYNFKQPVQRAIKILPEQERDVLLMRYALKEGSKPLRLQQIGSKYKITRERVRQIQNAGLAKLMQDKCLHELTDAVEQLQKAFVSCGGSTSEARICELVGAFTVSESRYVKLLLDAASIFHKIKETDHHNTYWTLHKEKTSTIKDLFKNIHNQIKKNDDELMTKEEVLDLIDSSIKNFSKNSIGIDKEEVLTISKHISKNAENMYGHVKHYAIALSNVGAKIKVALKKAGTPVHFKTLTKQINAMGGKKVNISTCLNELIRNKEFVLVGRGMYALATSGYRPGKTADIIALVLKEKGNLKKAEIIDAVKKERVVKEMTIIQALTNKKLFKRNSDATYSPAR